MTRVSVKPELLRWALERSGGSFTKLAEAFPKLDEWLSGDLQPTMNQLEAFAKRTGSPLGYFFLQTPPEESMPIPDFRTMAAGNRQRPSPDLIETIFSMQRRQGWMRDFLLDQGVEPLPFIGSAQPNETPVAIAKTMRTVLGLESGWAGRRGTWTEALHDFKEMVEGIGVLVVVNGVVGNNTHRTLDPKEFRGFVLCDPFAPLIFINGADAKGAQMFTLAHELAHLWLGKDAVFNLDRMQPADNEIERLCDSIAAEFLVPAVELRAWWAEATDEDTRFQFLARHFKVSPLVIARRALDLGLLSKPEFLAFYAAYLEDEHRHKQKDGGGDFFATQGGRIGKRFADAVFRAVSEGRLLYRDAYQLTGLHGATYDTFSKRLGYNP
jgi:Zn-dependent peptidase ImmA (M78 family)